MTIFAPVPKAFVIGWPISQSKSPIIHGHWLAHYGIDGSYEKIAVAPDELPQFIARLKDQKFVGGNVTIPHKQAILPLVDHVHPAAEKLGAANTVWFEDGKLHADTTDGYGFLANLDQHRPGWDKKNQDRAVLIGTGGASRPVIHGLLSRGVGTVTLVNRTRQRAQDLAELFATLGFEKRIEVGDWEKRSDLLEGCDLLINGSSLGMVGQPALDLSLESLPGHALVTDIVYNPLLTPLLQDAARRGNPVVDGLGMLLHQAVPGFEHWFGKRPTVDETLRQLVINA